MKIQKHSTIMNLINGIDMRLGYVGYAVVSTKWKTHQIATPFNRLYLIESGAGVLSAGGHEFTLEPGKAYLLPADLPCSYHCDDSLSLLFFHFNLVQANQFDLMRHVEHIAVVDFPADRFSHLRHICEKSSYRALPGQITEQPNYIVDKEICFFHGNPSCCFLHTHYISLPDRQTMNETRISGQNNDKMIPYSQRDVIP